MRKLWSRIGAFIFRILGQKEAKLTLGIKTQFRGRKNQFFLPEWQELAEVFKRTPDLEDYLRMQLEEAEAVLRTLSFEADGDRKRLVLTAQMAVLQDMMTLPEKAAAKAQALLSPKKAPSLKGMTYAR